jgi:hypothetical protein
MTKNNINNSDKIDSLNNTLEMMSNPLTQMKK